MIIYKNSNLFCFYIIFCLLLLSAHCKGGKGGGGGGRGGFGSFGGSRIGSSNTRLGGNVNNARTGYGSGSGGSGLGGSYGGAYGGNQYRIGAGAGSNGLGGSMYSGRSSGMRWASFGAGLLAYNAMSNLARSGHYHNHYHRNGYYSSHYTKYNGEWCMNNEDFNGTVFGKFQCPLPLPEPEFDPSAKYCCGSNQTQYCCHYFDDDSRRVTVLSAVLCVGAIIICSAFCISRLLKKRGSFFKPNQEYSTVNLSNVRNINRNVNSAQPYFNPMQNSRLPHPPNMRPPGPPCEPLRHRDGATAPFLPPNNQPQIYTPNSGIYQSVPYPMQSTMPQPAMVMPQPAMAMPQPSQNIEVNSPPPSYNEAISNVKVENSTNSKQQDSNSCKA